jgi:hypothetical protein
MSAQQVHDIVERIRALPIQEQVQVAEQLDRFTWAERWRQICARIAARMEASGEMITDEEIDEAVKEVRREKSLLERYSTRRS